MGTGENCIMRSFVIYTHTRNYPGGQIKDDTGGACNIHGGKQICIQGTC
jgi:hypothetical protein